MKELPKHIVDTLLSKKTSLGDSPALPPSDEFMQKMILSYYDEIAQDFEGKSITEVSNELNKLVKECQDEERKNRGALEKLCSDIVNNMFEIPEDTIYIDINLTDSVNGNGYRMLPEEDENYSFEDIEDMTNLSAEIYKRRMLNALVEGASESLAYNVGAYVQNLFDINPSLPALYKKIIEYSQYLMYALNETSLKTGNDAGGSVRVIMKSAPEMLEINVEATLFPILLQNTIKGVLEVSILQGLPDNKDKAYYVMKKSDFKLAEIWDSRLGVPLWKRLEKVMDENKVPINFFFMELSMLPTPLFNESLQEIFVGTKKGEKIVNAIISKIENKKEEEDFYDYIERNNSRYPIEDCFFTAEELLNKKPIDY